MRPLLSCCRKKSFPTRLHHLQFEHGLSTFSRSLTLKLIPSYFTTYFSVTQLSSSDHHCHTSMPIYHYDLISHPTSHISLGPPGTHGSTQVNSSQPISFMNSLFSFKGWTTGASQTDKIFFCNHFLPTTICTSGPRNGTDVPNTY